MEPGGFIVLHRKALESWLWQLPEGQFKVALTILLKANWRPGKGFYGKVVEVDRGQFITSFDSLAAAAGVSKKTARTAVANLESAGFLAREAARTHQVLTVLNYSKYQDLPDDDRHTERHATGTPSGIPPAYQRHTTGTPPAPIEQEQPFNQDLSDSRASAPDDQPPPPSKPTPKDLARVHADLIWQEQEDLRLDLKAEGIPGGPGPGLVSSLKLELVHRLEEQAAGRGWDWGAAAEACRHVLRVLAAEARRDWTLRWLDGRHWETDRFAATLAMDPVQVAQGQGRRGKGDPKPAKPYQLGGGELRVLGKGGRS